MDRWQLRLRKRRASTGAVRSPRRCDLEQVVKADIRPYRHTSLTRKWMHRQSFQVPSFGHNQVWTDHTGTRFSTHCKRTSISARPERRRSHAMERLPSWECSILPTMDRKQLKRTRYRIYCCRLDQLSDTLGTGPPERTSMLRRSPRGFFGPRRGASGRDQGPRFEHSTSEIAHLGVQDVTNSDIGLASVPKEIEDNAMTKGTIDVQ